MLILFNQLGSNKTWMVNKKASNVIIVKNNAYKWDRIYVYRIELSLCNNRSLPFYTPSMRIDPAFNFKSSVSFLVAF